MESPSTPSRSPLCDSHAEEIASVVTHGAGLLFSVFATVAMVLATLMMWTQTINPFLYFQF